MYNITNKQKAISYMLQIEVDYEILKVAKIFIITIFTYYTTRKIMNKKITVEENNLSILIMNIIIIIIYCLLRDKIGLILDTIILIGLLAVIIAKNTNKNIGYTIICTAISLTINDILYFVSSAIIYIPSRALNISNVYTLFPFIILVYAIVLYLFLKIRKIKNGLDFLNTSVNNEYFEILFLNISAIILFSVILFVDCNINVTDKVGVSLIILAFIMFITILKSLKQYYKQKLLEQELEKIKQELVDKTKEVKDLEAENISISKKSHTLAHKQKSLEHKIEEMMNKTEISKEEAAEVRNRLKEIGKDLYKEKTTIELDKTGIEQVDDMLKYMQSECSKNKIDFELQLKGNIHYMTNNLITKEDLETLLADHIKNAIIAINHTDNINRSILVRLGKIDETYGLYIYDSGVEFKPETLENLGKKPSTTHADEGGTGMGFMNTFDTLRKCNASLIIEEYNEPNKDNYTKALLIKFDNKNEFKIKSYRQNKKQKFSKITWVIHKKWYNCGKQKRKWE